MVPPTYDPEVKHGFRDGITKMFPEEERKLI